MSDDKNKRTVITLAALIAGNLVLVAPDAAAASAPLQHSLEHRVSDVREALARMSKVDLLPVSIRPVSLAQFNQWNNWNNFNNFANWNNWGNWGNWGNWVNV